MMRRQPTVSPVSLSIRQAVKMQPGIHFRGLGRAAHVTSAGQLRHHLDRLERQGLIVEVADGRYKRFFVAGQQDPRLRAEMARFSRPVPRLIAKLLLSNPMNRTQLRRSLGCADSTLGYHLARMVALGDLARIRNPTACLYSLTNGEGVRRMLQAATSAATPAASPVDPDDGTDELPNPLRPRPRPPGDGPAPRDPPEPLPEDWPLDAAGDSELGGDVGADWPLLPPSGEPGESPPARDGDGPA
jgi:DNA-binding MarR family transcriptional regulator